MKLLQQYINGNYTVQIYQDGTKIRFTEDDEFNAKFPENIDLKITNWCDIGCSFCHENSTTSGKYVDLTNEKNLEFLATLQLGTELAIGGGKVTSFPNIERLLSFFFNLGLISNITIQQRELFESRELIERLIKQKDVHGVGISISTLDDEVIKFAQANPNVVLHTIAGVHGKEMYEYLADKNVKILILGYKTFRRGVNYFEKFGKTVENNINWLKDNIKTLLPKFRVLSFDNLAIEQLEIKKALTPEAWETFYMGDDGQHTMYIDWVKGEFAKNSTSEKRYPLMSDIREMFAIIKRE